MQAPKNGFFYVLDRRTGKLISAEKIGKVSWADRIDLATGRPVEARDIRYETGAVTIWPSPIGAHNWQAMSFSPRSGLVYIPYMQVGARFSKGAPEPGDVSAGGLNIGLVKADSQDGKAALLAWDPVHQRARWKAPLDTFWNGGTLATAGDLVFQGTADGYFSAYDASAGDRLWRFNAGLGIIAAPISYSAGGKQYVSVLVGYGGSASASSNLMHVGWKYGAQPRLLLTFGLDGHAQLPPSAPPDMRVKAVDDPSIRHPGRRCRGGSQPLLHGLCDVPWTRSGVGRSTCAGSARISGRADPDSFWTVVHEGASLRARDAALRDAHPRPGHADLRLHQGGGARGAWNPQAGCAGSARAARSLSQAKPEDRLVLRDVNRDAATFFDRHVA